jgi:diguanylate cyclase (GGDEF)-like protein/PAS domain S-box-containing protein
MATASVPAWRRRRRLALDALLLLAFTAGYAGLARAGLALDGPGRGGPAIWPASGLALVALLVVDRRRWPWLVGAVAVASLAVQWTLPDPPALGVPMAVANAVEPLIAALLAQRVSGVRRGVRLASARGALGLIAAAAIAAAFGACLGVAALAAAPHAALPAHVAASGHHGPPGGAPPSPWIGLWLANLIGMLAGAPLLLLRIDEGNRGLRIADGAFVALTGLVTAGVFSNPTGHPPGLFQKTSMIFPLLLLTALFRGTRATGAAVLAVASIASVATAVGYGPYAAPMLSAFDRVQQLQMFLLVLLLTSLLLAAVLAERRAAERSSAESAERFGSVLRAATEFCVIATDLRGRITIFNEGAERMLGYRAEEMLGRSPMRLHDPAEIEARAVELGLEPGPAVIVALPRAGQADRQDWTFTRADGSRLTVSYTVTAMYGEDGAPMGYIGIGYDVTAHRAATQALAESEERHRILLAGLPDTMLALHDHELRLVALEGPMVTTLEIPREQMIGKLYNQVMPPQDVAQYGPYLERALDGQTGALDWVSSTGRDWEVEIAPVRAGDGPVTGVLAVMRNVTDRRRQEREIRRAEADLRTIFEAGPIGNAVVDGEGRIVGANAALATICGLPCSENPGVELGSLLHPGDAPALREGLAELRAGACASLELEVRLRPGEGGQTFVSAHASLLDPEDGNGRVLVQLLDVTERKRSEERLVHMADHDPLTGLLNRRRFRAELDRHVAESERYGPEGAVIVLDVDHFKQVNDTLGHNVGDELIASIAEVLAQRLRSTDVLARLGGDEFAVLLPRADRDEAEAVARTLVEEVRTKATFLAGARVRRVTISVGVAMVEPGSGNTGEEVLVAADLAMYDAKDAGRDRHAFFRTPDRDEARTKVRLNWVERIRDAIDHDGFVLAAQPIVDLRSGAVTQHELLLRMVDDEGDLVPPGAFLGVAERYGLMAEIDRWVASEAIGLLAEAERHGTPLRLEVNISGSSLGDAALLAALESDLRAAAIDPRNLIFEVTETAAVADVTLARRFADRLAALGCRFALDDFGAGFGSFYYLKHLPCDYVKIDGEFVAGCTSSETDRLVIGSLVSLAHGMGKQTIAEFVGDEQTQRQAAALGVDFAQGFHVGRPVPLRGPGRAAQLIAAGAAAA